MPNVKTTINLSLPTSLKEKARTQARTRNFSTMSDYLQHLIREDSEHADQKKQLEAFLKKGIDSGKPVEMTLPQMKKWMTQTIKDAKSS